MRFELVEGMKSRRGMFFRKTLRTGAALLPFFAAILLAPCAVARPQDEVMSNAYRCAAIASTRVWLDCYYGAAQPMREVLGLKPALAAQIELNRSPPAGGEGADQDRRNQVMTNASRCSALTAGQPWLECYYSAAAPVRSLLGLSAPPQAMASTSAPAPNPPQAASHHVNAIAAWLGAKDFFVESRMSSYASDSEGRFTVTLANGQTWRQVGTDRVARLSRPAASYIVTITGGAFGSYNLAIKGETGMFKVRPAL